MINIPSYSGKDDLKSLSDFPLFEFDAELFLTGPDKFIFGYEKNKFKYEYAFCKSENYNNLFILFSGDAPRSKLQPPVFQRWKWADKFPGHVLYVSDPALRLDPELGLAWYAGIQELDFMIEIVEMVKLIIGKLNISSENVVSYGSSGGGYAALRFNSFLPDCSVVAINPQTRIVSYYPDAVNKFICACFPNNNSGNIDKEFGRRVDLIELAKDGAFNQSRIIYVQNLVDKHHLENHFKPFINAIFPYACNFALSNKFHFLPFFHDDGHGKAEPKEIFTKIIESLSFKL